MEMTDNPVRPALRAGRPSSFSEAPFSVVDEGGAQ